MSSLKKSSFSQTDSEYEKEEFEFCPLRIGLAVVGVIFLIVFASHNIYYSAPVNNQESYGRSRSYITHTDNLKSNNDDFNDQSNPHFNDNPSFAPTDKLDAPNKKWWEEDFEEDDYELLPDFDSQKRENENEEEGMYDPDWDRPRFTVEKEQEKFDDEFNPKLNYKNFDARLNNDYEDNFHFDPMDRTAAIENKWLNDDFEADDHDPADDELMPASKFKPANWEKSKRDPNTRSVREKNNRNDDGNNWKNFDDDIESLEWGVNKKKNEIKHGSNRHLAREKTEGRSKLPINSPVDPTGAAPNKKWWEEDFEEPDLDDEPVAAKNKWGDENFNKNDFLMPDEDDLLLPDEDDFLLPDDDDFLMPNEDDYLLPDYDFSFDPTDKAAAHNGVWSGEEENYFAHDLLKADGPEHGTYDPNWDRPRFTDKKSGNGYADGMKWTDLDEEKQDELDEEYGRWKLDRDEDRFNGQREKRRPKRFEGRLYNVKV